MRQGIGVQIDKFETYDLLNARRLEGTGTVQLPPDENMSNTTKVTGLGGEINVPARGMMAASTATYSIPQMYGGWLASIQNGKSYVFTIRGSMTVVTSEKENVDVPVRWDIEGPISKKDNGKLEQAATGDGSIEQHVWAFRQWVDGDVVREWDVVKNINRIGGVDINADVLRNIMA